MDRNQKAFVNAQLREFQKGFEGSLQNLIVQLNHSFGQLGNNLQGAIAAINTLTLQQEALLDQLVEKGIVDKEKFGEDVAKKFEEENQRRQEMIEQIQKQQEAIAHAENNTELEDSTGEDCGCCCDNCEHCEFEAQFEDKEEVEEECCCGECECGEPVLASERNKVIKFPSGETEEE